MNPALCLVILNLSPGLPSPTTSRLFPRGGAFGCGFLGGRCRCCGGGLPPFLGASTAVLVPNPWPASPCPWPILCSTPALLGTAGSVALAEDACRAVLLVEEDEGKIAEEDATLWLRSGGEDRRRWRGPAESRWWSVEKAVRFDLRECWMPLGPAVLTIARLAVAGAAVKVLNAKALVPIDGRRKKQADDIRARAMQREDLHACISILPGFRISPYLLQQRVQRTYSIRCLSVWNVPTRPLRRHQHTNMFKFTGGCSMYFGVIFSGYNYARFSSARLAREGEGYTACYRWFDTAKVRMRVCFRSPPQIYRGMLCNNLGLLQLHESVTTFEKSKKVTLCQVVSMILLIL